MSESLLKKALLDACVIFRAALRDTLLRAAESGLYEVFWSDFILDEATRNLIQSGRMSAQQAQRLLGAMDGVFPNAKVREFESLIPQMTNSEKDRHVLAAAVAVGAKVIVSSNVRDFPPQALAPFGVEIRSPDEFLIYLFDEAPKTMMQIVRAQAEQLRRPPKTVAEVLDDISVHAPQFATVVRSRMKITDF